MIGGDVRRRCRRLQAAARPGRTVGERMCAATRCGSFRELEPLTLEGKPSGSPPGGRPHYFVSGPIHGRPASPPIPGWAAPRGELLESLLDRSIREQRLHLVTAIGQAGVQVASPRPRQKASEHPAAPRSAVSVRGRLRSLRLRALQQFEIAGPIGAHRAGSLSAGSRSSSPPQGDRRAADRVAAATAVRFSSDRAPPRADRRGRGPGADPLLLAVRSVIEERRAATPRPRDRGHPLGRRGRRRSSTPAPGLRPGADRLRPRGAPGPRTDGGARLNATKIDLECW